MSFDYEYDPRADDVEPDWDQTPEYDELIADGCTHDEAVEATKRYHEKQRELDGIADAGHELDERRNDE